MRRVLVTVVLAASAWAAPANAAPGDLDGAFSSDGFAEIEPGVGPLAMAAGPLGSTVVAGYSTRPDGSSVDEAWIARYTAAGELDGSFGRSGSMRYDVGPMISNPQGDFWASDLAVGGDGSLVVGGGAWDGESRGFVMRLRSDGSLASGFGANGIIALDEHVLDVALDGSRVLATSDDAVWAWLADGAPDPGYGSGGTVDSAAAKVVALDGRGSAVLGKAKEKSVIVSRLDSSGQPDPEFAGTGSAEIDLGIDHPVALAGLESIAVGGGGEIAIGALICYPLSTGPDGGAGYCEPTIPGATPSGVVLGQIVDDPTGWALATDVGGDRFLAGGDRALGRSTGPIALSRNRFDGTYDRSFGRGGTAIAYYGLEGGKITDLAVDDQRVSALVDLGDEHKLARFRLDPGPADADADRHPDADDRCDFFYARSPSGCPRVPRIVHLDHLQHRLSAVLRSVIEGCEERERVSVYRRQPGRDELIRRGRTNRSSVLRVARNPPRGAYYAVAKRHLKTEAGRCSFDRSRVRVVHRS